MALSPVNNTGESRSGSSGSGLPIATQLSVAAKKTAQNRSKQGLSALDPRTDIIWAQGASESLAPNSYFDYFFTGQDIQCYIDGAEGSGANTALPIMEFAFSIQQQKVPVFGFWSYTFDAVMRGNRTLQGMFRLATKSPNYLVEKVSQAAKTRAQGGYDYHVRGLDKDEENIERYWNRNIDADDKINGNYRSLFSSHPPFNFVIAYGIQSTSIANDRPSRLMEVMADYATGDNMLMTDTNERLVQTSPNNTMRYVINNVEITSLQVEYSPNGEVCSEVYSFFARDLHIPRLLGHAENMAGSSSVEVPQYHE